MSNNTVVGAILERLKKHSDPAIMKMAADSKGDVTLVEGYDNMVACLARLRTMDRDGALSRPINAAYNAHAALLKNKAGFKKAYTSEGSDSIRFVYTGAVASLWHTVSLLCADGVIYVKNPYGLHNAVINKNSSNSLSNSIPVTRLEKFVEMSNSYGFNENVLSVADEVEKEALCEAIGTMIALGVTGLVALLYLARDMIEYFYKLRGSVARWLDLQSQFLMMNAATVNPNMPGVREKQEKYAQTLTSLADRIRVDSADADRSAAESIRNDDRELKNLSAASTDFGGNGAQARLL